MSLAPICAPTLAALIACSLGCQPRDLDDREREPRIHVAMSLHMDPTDPPRYDRQREALYWFIELAEEKGFFISGAMTGVYAELCVKYGHVEDFTEFMPGGPHILGTHLHSHYKTEEDWEENFLWTEDTEHSPDLAPEVFGHQIPFINQLFTDLGFLATDNSYFHGSHTHSHDMAASYGVTPNDNTYENIFDVIEGARGLFHPYRGDPDADVSEAVEDVSSPFVAVPVVSGMMGFNVRHGPEGMTMGTLPFAQRDFLLVYLEWLVHRRRGLPEKPWTYGFGTHPHHLLEGEPGTDGVEVRVSLAAMVDWLNEHFIGSVATYATQRTVAEEFMAWEEDNPRQAMYGSAGGAVQVELLTGLIYDEIHGGGFHLLDYQDTGDVLVMAFDDQERQPRLVLVSSEAGAAPQPVDTSPYFHDVRVRVVALDGSEEVSPTRAVPVGDEPVLVRPLTPDFPLLGAKTLGGIPSHLPAEP